MIQIKDFVKCGSPERPYELHVSHAEMEELIKRDIAIDKILELRDDDSGTHSQEDIIIKITEYTENLKILGIKS